jgi:hypothetical protein
MQDFEIIRGDTCYLEVIKEDDTGTPIPFDVTDTFIFSAKKNIKQDTYDIQSTKFQLNSGKAIIELNTTDTNVEVGEYYYDIVYKTTNDEEYTLCKGILTVDWDVTR